MRDVIQEMLKAEAEAKRIVAEAETEAERIRTEARRQAQQLLDQSRAEARAEADRIADGASRRSEDERQAAIARAAETIEAGLRMDEQLRTRAVEGIGRCVCGET